jgi:hypothetical protein
MPKGRQLGLGLFIDSQCVARGLRLSCLVFSICFLFVQRNSWNLKPKLLLYNFLYICLYIYIYICIYMYVYMYIIYVFIYIYTYIHLHIHLHVRICSCMFRCRYVYMYVYIHVHMDMYSNTDKTVISLKITKNMCIQ